MDEIVAPQFTIRTFNIEHKTSPSPGGIYELYEKIARSDTHAPAHWSRCPIADPAFIRRSPESCAYCHRRHGAFYGLRRADLAERRVQHRILRQSFPS